MDVYAERSKPEPASDIVNGGCSAQNSKVRPDGSLNSKSKSQRLRCAIYTRKSSEEGLEQDFNSLHAQREACEAYISSQTSLGWKLISKPYDDGGVSGGTMNRPALQELLEDIRMGLVDVIVVYKIDRLTRSLMDFAKMVDVFDGKGVSFVSVTQQFNTTTSMGRLTLNVLLSFAQFEREVTGERIRDKIAASKKKGMWMGGKVPLGYRVEDRKLLLDNQEAKTVRYLFNRYLELGSVTKLVEDAKANGLSGRVVKQKNGTIKTTQPLGRGNLYHLPSNPIYVGKIAHKQEIYDGQHEAIIDAELWHKVRAKLKQNAVSRKLGTNTHSRNLLTGLLYDADGNRLTPSHANKKGVRYSYYVTNFGRASKRKSNDVKIAPEKPSSKWRMPAAEIDQAVLNIINKQLKDQPKLAGVLGAEDISVEQHQVMKQAVDKLVATLTSSSPVDQRRLLSKLLNRIELHQDKIVLAISKNGLSQLLGNEFASKFEDTQSSSQQEPYHVEVPYKLRKRGVEIKLIIGQSELQQSNPDHTLIKLIAKAHDFKNKLTNGTAGSIKELAEAEGYNRYKLSRLLPLTFLAPDIIESIMAGTQPVDLTADMLRRLSDLPINWSEQKTLLGYDT